MFDVDKTDEELHRVDIESLERRIMELALERTGAHHGAIFLHDRRAKGLAIDFHIVDGLVVTMPGALLRRRLDGRPNGIAMWVLDHNQPYNCQDAERDPHYARYFFDVASIAAVPIPYQKRAIGVISVSSRGKRAFGEEDLDALGELAAASAKFLRRAQLFRSARASGSHPFLIKGLSPAWLEVERRIEQVAPTDAPVLVVGESGTGKDLVSRAVHFNSRRAAAPYVTVNCAAIPETLLESALFGHVKGAFTGATVDKVGEFRKAHGGTLFLDELGELPMALQAKVLRAIEQGEVLPVGSSQAPEHVDVRLICATNRDLPRMVRERRFRDDLYYRVSVITMELPPLRSYQEANLETLAHVFLSHAVNHHHLAVRRLSPEALAALRAYDFPGNVRELKNVIEHAAIMARSARIEPHDLPKTVLAAGKGPGPGVPVVAVGPAGGGTGVAAGPPSGDETLDALRERWLAPLETRYLGALLDACQGRVAEAARRAGVNKVTLYRLLKKRGIELERRVRDS